jgi:hypothetical protein
MWAKIKLLVLQKPCPMDQQTNQDFVETQLSLSSRLQELAQLFLKLGTIG